MLHVGGLDCVFILTSDWLHHRMTIACLRAGLPVLVEKPPGILIEETEDIVRGAKETGTTLVVGFNRRFTWHQVLSRLEERLQLCIARWLRSTYESPWTILSGSIHAIDNLACTGGAPERIVVEGGFDPDRKETVIATIEFTGGGRGVLISRHGGQNFNADVYEAYGANARVSLRRLDQGRIERAGSGEPETFKTVGDSLALEHRHFLECVRGERRTSISSGHALAYDADRRGDLSADRARSSRERTTSRTRMDDSMSQLWRSSPTRRSHLRGL